MTFARGGRFVHRCRWSVLIVSLLPLGAALAIMSRGVTFEARALVAAMSRVFGALSRDIATAINDLPR